MVILAYSGGSGTEADPYQISTKADLLYLGTNTADYSEHFIMTADIDLAGEVFDRAVIAPDIDDVESKFQGTPFTGIFDGGGHVISNLVIDTDSAGKEFIGLFGCVEGKGSIIKNLNVADVSIQTLDGTDDVWGNVDGHCPKLSWQSDDGPLVPEFDKPYTTLKGDGTEDYPFLIESYADFCEFCENNDLTAGYYRLMADIDLSEKEFEGSVINRTFYGHFNGNGHSIYNLQIVPLYGMGFYQASAIFSVLYGTVSDLNVVNADVNSTGSATHTAVLCGLNEGGILRCSVSGSVFAALLRDAIGNVHEPQGIGGICAVNRGQVNECYSEATVVGVGDASFMGSLCGANEEFGVIQCCYSSGDVLSGDDSVMLGGLCGVNRGSIDQCYSVGDVSAGELSSDIGGLCGFSSGAISSVYFDVSAGPDNLNGIPLTVEEMLEQSSFGGFNFGSGGCWSINPGHYPKLTWQNGDGYYPITGTVNDGVLSIPSVLKSSVALTGSGLPEDPYIIRSNEDFLEFSANDSYTNGYYRLTADLFLGGFHFTNAAVDRVFYGTLDGGGHVIHDFIIFTNTSPAQYIGIFAENHGHITRLGVEGLSLPERLDLNHHSSGICGSNSGVISECYLTGRIIGLLSGGICAINKDGIIKDCWFSSDDVIFNDYLSAGICESIQGGVIDNCYVGGNGYYVDPLGNTLNATPDIYGWSYIDPLGRVYKTNDVSSSFSVSEINDIGEQGLIDAGWDFVGESANGTNDIWLMDGLPRLTCFQQVDQPDYLEIAGPDFVVGGTVTNYACLAHYEDGSKGDVTPSVIWSVDDAQCGAVISGANSFFTGTILPDQRSCVLTAEFNGVTVIKNIMIVDSPTALIDIQIAGPELVREGETSQYACTAYFADGSSIDVTSSALWFSDSVMPNAVIENGELGVWGCTSNLQLTVTAEYTHANVTHVNEFYVQVVNFSYSGGSGSVTDPIQITTAADLLQLAATPADYNKHFQMLNDVDLVGYSFNKAVIAPTTSTLMYSGTKFTGLFNGNGNVIRNLSINTAGDDNDYLGLFGYLDAGAVVCNLGLENASAIGGSGGSDYIAGLCGFCEDSTVSNCYASVTASGDDYIGAICGKSDGGSFVNCWSSGSLSGDDYIAGLVGYLYKSSAGKCHSYASVTGDRYSGGLLGRVYSATVNASFWDTQISGYTISAGGTGKTTAEMQTQSTFTDAGWDFTNSWYMDGYPVLRCFTPVDTYDYWLMNNAAIPIALRDMSDVPASDNIPNLLKYACGLPAMDVCTTADLMSIESGEANIFSILYYKSKTAEDVTLQPIWAESLLGPWSTLGITTEKLGEDPDREQWKASIPLGDSGFIKLRVLSE